ncbi:MAG: cupin domain-containing protein [Bacteroidales bacterium]
MKRVAIAAACVTLLVTAALAQQPAGTSGSMSGSMSSSGGVMVPASEAKWMPAPPSLPAGAQIAVLEGDPSQSGPFTLQVKMPDGYQVKPHTHPTDERQTVVQGTLMMGMGEKWSDGEMKSLDAGSFVMLPARHAHYVQAKGTAILQVEAIGPYDMTYINASDDPRKK